MKHMMRGLLVVMLGLTAAARAETPPDSGPPAPPATSPGPVEFFNGVHARFVVPKPAPVESPGQDPLAAITDEMGDIAHDLGARKTGDPTQGKQKEVVTQLDQIIMELEKQCKGGGSGMSRNPTKPLADSKIVKGPGGMGDLIQPKSDQKNIANLPTKERDRIMQSKTEGFPPGYESLLSTYYTRLAQEKVNDEAAEKSVLPTTKPVRP